MKVQVNGLPAYAFNGNQPINPERPTVLFVHGAALDHTVWTLPARYFSRQGHNVLAVDLPGHGLSEGKCQSAISDYADWLIEFLEAVGIEQTALVGHSMGSLIALDCAGRYIDRIRALVLIGTAVPMPVTDLLLDAAKNNTQRAIEMLTAWGHSPSAHIGGNETPGMWMIGGLARLFERGGLGTLYNDLMACNNYMNGMVAARNVACPTMLILGEHDMLTPARAAEKLTAEIENSQTIVLEKTGHTIMSEKPDSLLDCLIRIV